MIPRMTLSIMSCVICLSWAMAADPPATPEQAATLEQAATPEQAARAIDLNTFELIDPVNDEGIINRTIAGQSYISTSSVGDVSARIKKKLIDSGWSPLQGGTTTDQYSNEMYRKDGFTLSLSVSVSTKPNQSRIMIMNHGNVDLSAIEMPQGLKKQFENPVMSMLQSPWSVEETNQKIAAALNEAGWEPYGSPVGSQQFKQNGIRLNVNVMAAPAQSGRTIVQISTEQMSADLPVPKESTGVQYADTTRQVQFDHAKRRPEVFRLIRERLQSLGWKATTDEPIKIGFREHLIFRNSLSDMIQVEAHDVDGKTRASIQFKTAQEVKSMNEKLQAEADRKKAEMARQADAPPIEIPRPSGSEIKSTTDTKIEFVLPTGKAPGAIRTWTAQLKRQGWDVTINASERVAGDLTLKKDGMELSVTYVDPGFIPASISVSVFGKGAIKVK